jgi:hypothetical protein
MDGLRRHTAYAVPQTQGRHPPHAGTQWQRPHVGTAAVQHAQRTAGSRRNSMRMTWSTAASRNALSSLATSTPCVLDRDETGCCRAARAKARSEYGCAVHSAQRAASGARTHRQPCQPQIVLACSCHSSCARGWCRRADIHQEEWTRARSLRGHLPEVLTEGVPVSVSSKPA